MNKKGNINHHVVIKGAGDLATGIGHVLFREGFKPIMTELPYPTVVRRKVAFAEAVYAGEIVVEGIKGKLANCPATALQYLDEGIIPIIIDPMGTVIKTVQPAVVVDARIAKRNLGTSMAEAPVVVGIGPGFVAGEDVHLVVESNRGENLGKIYTQGGAEPDTGIPGKMYGYDLERVIRAPVAGVFVSTKKIGQLVEAGEPIGYIDEKIPVVPKISGVLRGLLHNGLKVNKDFKMGDVDPRGNAELCYIISDKANLIGQAVLTICKKRCN